MFDRAAALAICDIYRVELDPTDEYETFLCHLEDGRSLWIVPRVQGDYMILDEI